MATPTDTDVLTLVQWFSPAFPVGAFAYSHGLEWAITSGDVVGVDAVSGWIADVLEHGAGWNDCLFLVAGYAAESPDALTALDAECCALAASAERLLETRMQGRAFCRIFADVWPHGDPGALAYPVAVGHAARCEALPPHLTTQMYLQGVLANLVSAATRLGAIGQTDGQRLIRDLTPLALKVASRAQDAGPAAMSSTAFLSDIASMKHETQYSRMFRT
ncbi:urease accessory protein UreF [Roseivivax sp. CAU 1753]